MKNLIVWTMLSICSFGCKNGSRQEATALSEATTSREQAIEARRKRVNQLYESCAPEDTAKLVLIASGRYDWHDSLDARPHRRQLPAPDIRKIQCLAMRRMSDTSAWPPRWNFMALRQQASALNRPTVLQALSSMLGDDRHWCDESVLQSPRDAALALAWLPLHALRGKLAAFGTDEVQNLNRDLDYHPGPRAAEIDATVADGGAESFTALLDLLSPSHQWNDGLPPPTEKEREEIQKHELDALLWLKSMASRSPTRARGCQRRIQEEIAHGELGARVVARLDNPDPKIREALLLVLAMVARPGTEQRLQEVAEKDPDPDVRSMAETALRYFGIGGMFKKSTTPRPTGPHTGSPNPWTSTAP